MRSRWLMLAAVVVIAVTALLPAGSEAAKADLSGAGETFIHDGITYTSHRSETDKRLFFFNTESQQSTYIDPRKDVDKDHGVALLVFALPFLLLLGGGGSYLLYLKVYKPDVLKAKKKKGAAAAKRPSPTSPVKAPGSPKGPKKAGEAFAAALEAAAAPVAEVKKAL